MPGNDGRSWHGAGDEPASAAGGTAHTTGGGAGADAAGARWFRGWTTGRTPDAPHPSAAHGVRGLRAGGRLRLADRTTASGADGNRAATPAAVDRHRPGHWRNGHLRLHHHHELRTTGAWWHGRVDRGSGIRAGWF